jgi:hypothetical protein
VAVVASMLTVAVLVPMLTVAEVVSMMVVVAAEAVGLQQKALLWKTLSTLEPSQKAQF